MQKPTFRRCRDSVDFRVSFYGFFDSLGTNLHDFWCLGAGLKFIDFHSYSWEVAQIQATHPGRGNFGAAWVPNKHSSIFIQSEKVRNIVLSTEDD